MQDFAYFKSLYPAACKQMQLCVEAVCDELEYEGSPIYDEYPDRIFLEKLTKRALEKWQKVYPAGTERTDTLTTYMKAADVGTVSTEEGTGDGGKFPENRFSWWRKRRESGGNQHTAASSWK